MAKLRTSSSTDCGFDTFRVLLRAGASSLVLGGLLTSQAALAQDRQQTTAAVPFKKGQLQLLQVVVRLKPQAVLRGLGKIAPEHVVEIFKKGLSCPDHKRDHSKTPQLLTHGAETQPRKG